MDPKNFPSNLDPKLKETYERVMGMSLGNSPAGTQQAPPTGATQVPGQVPGVPAVPGVAAETAHAENIKPGAPSPVATPATGIPPLPSMPSAMPTSVGPQMPPPAALPPLPGLSTLKSPVVSPSMMTDTSASPSVSPEENKEPAKKGSIVKILLFAVGGIVFLLVYTVVWVKVFNLTLPFKLPF